MKVLTALPPAMLLMLLGGCAPEPDRSVEVTILHTNDTHARIAEFDRFGSTCSAEQSREGGCFGGVARRATAIAAVRADTEHVLLLDGGDQFQGTLFYNRYKGEVAARFMNLLHYDAMTLGNHEFDDGTEILGRFVGRLEFPVLAANVDATHDPDLDGKLAPWAIVTLGDARVGLVGCITEDTAQLSRAGDKIDFLPIEESVGEAVDELRAQGIDKIILLSHAGYAREQRLAASVPGLDVVVGGHSNTLLSNRDENAVGPYPTVIEGPEGHPVLVVQDYAWGKYLGRLDVVFDHAGVPVSWQGEPILLDSSIAPDEDVERQVGELLSELEVYTRTSVGATRTPLEGGERVCRAGECSLGDLVADALLELHRDQGVEIALQNAGGIRSSLGAGPLTIGQLLEVLPFGNTASVFGLRGEDLKAALEHGVSRVEDLEGRFLQVAGLRYSWTAAAPVGSRIREVEVDDDGDWRALDPDRIYRVVSNDFTRNGGDGFEVLAARAIDPYDQGRPVVAVLREYIEARSPIDVALDGRIRQLP